MEKMLRCVKHFITVCRHKYYVGTILFKEGLYWQGITHDLSKFSPVEFGPSAKYFNGKISPIEAEKAENGYSSAWLHHKSHNKHHWQYWLDYKNGETIISDIPDRYLKEMAADVVGASKAYLQGEYNREEPIKYFRANRYSWLMTSKDKNTVSSYIKQFSTY